MFLFRRIKKLIALCHRRGFPSEAMDKNLRCFERRIISCYGGQINVGLLPIALICAEGKRISITN